MRPHNWLINIKTGRFFYQICPERVPSYKIAIKR